VNLHFRVWRSSSETLAVVDSVLVDVNLQHLVVVPQFEAKLVETQRRWLLLVSLLK
jgi:hypothetical protein